MMSIRISLMVLATTIITLKTFADIDGTGYAGSQAYNSTQVFEASVDASTGVLNFSYPLIKTRGRLANLQVNLGYRYNAKGMFGLPEGWFLDLDYIADKMAFIHGKQWLIDPLWHDQTLYASGLKYLNAHGSRFIDNGTPEEIPGHKGCFYQYRAEFKDGSQKYFSQQGLLVLDRDRFGNTVQYTYIEPVASLHDARLKAITDNYGNTCKLSYAPNEIRVTYPDGRHSIVYYNRNGVAKIVNPLKQAFTIDYTETNGQTLMRNVQSPSGLVTAMVYDTVACKRDGKISSLPVVTKLRTFDLSTQKNVQETYYKYSKDNNFTGFPYYSQSDNSDGLMDSNNQYYRYSVEVSKSNLSTDQPLMHTQVFYYNYLHLPVEMYTLKAGKPYLKTTYEYAIAPFKYNRSTNYDKPAAVTHFIWDAGNQVFIPSDKTTSLYDNFGNKTENRHFIYNREAHDWVTLSSSYHQYDTDHYSLLRETIDIDELTGKQRQKQYRLAEDQKTYQSMVSRYRESGADTPWNVWQQETMQYDNYGRQVLSSRKWLATGKPGVQESRIKTQYQFNSDTAELTLIKQSHLGSLMTQTLDTRNNNVTRMISPMGDVTSHDYDALGQLIRTTDPLGNETRFIHETYQGSGLNAMTRQTPMNNKTRIIHDALGRVIQRQDMHEGHWRTQAEYQYNGFNKIISERNQLGLETIKTYDEQGRLTGTRDPWGNNKHISYDDIHLTTTITDNGRKQHEKSTLPWQATTFERYFPNRDNPNDKQTAYLENKAVANGWGQVVRTENSLVEAATAARIDPIKTLYRYDASGNRCESIITGYDGIHYHRKTAYDLFNNKASYKKAVVTPYSNSTHEGYHYHYNEDNMLTAIETPKKSGASQITRYTYDKAGNKTHTYLPGGQRIDYQHDALQRLTATSWQRQGQMFTVNQDYDADGHLIGQTDNQGARIQYTYYANGHLLSMTYPDGKAVTYTYDAFDRKLTQVDVNGAEQGYLYHPDDKGELSGIQFGEGQIQYSYGQDENGYKGQLKKQTLTLTNQQPTETLYEYGALGALSQVKTTNSEGLLLYDVAYHHNARGQLLHQQTQVASEGPPLIHDKIDYQYDSMNRLLSEQHDKGHCQDVIRYRYDGNNNMTQKTTEHCGGKRVVDYEYDAWDQQIAQTDTALPGRASNHYDENGRLIQDNRGVLYQYDDLDYLLTVTSPEGKTVDYRYLPNGLLGEKQSGQHVRHFYYGPDARVQTEINADDTSRFIRSGGTIVAGVTHKGVDQLYQANNSTGAILKSDGQLTVNTYDGYGQRTGPPTTDAVDDYGWDQEFTDPDAELTYLRYRFYHQNSMRFMTRDNYPQDNRYEFARANPVTNLDPTGHSAQQAINYGLGTAIAAAGAYGVYETTILGVVGMILAIPTGGTSLSLSAGAGIAAATATTLSGVAMIGSQAAMDTGNKSAAKALQYASIALHVITAIDAVVAIAPTIRNMFFLRTNSLAATETPSMAEAGLSNARSDAAMLTQKKITQTGITEYEGVDDLSKWQPRFSDVKRDIAGSSGYSVDGFDLKTYLEDNPGSDFSELAINNRFFKSYQVHQGIFQPFIQAFSARNPAAFITSVSDEVGKLSYAINGNHLVATVTWRQFAANAIDHTDPFEATIDMLHYPQHQLMIWGVRCPVFDFSE